MIIDKKKTTKERTVQIIILKNYKKHKKYNKINH